MCGSASDRMRAMSWGETVMRPHPACVRRRFVAGQKRVGKGPGLAALRQQARDGGAQLRNACTSARRGREHLRVGCRVLVKRRLRVGKACGELSYGNLIGLGEYDLIVHRGLVQRCEHAIVDWLESVARVDEHIDAGEIGA